MITPDVENSYKLAGIWLRCSLASHDFIDARYWQGNLALMRDVYLPAAENFVYRETPEGEILGFISLRDGHIEALFVDLPYQGRGIGAKLLEFAKQMHHRLTLNVYAQNTGAVRFYISNGLRETSREIDPHTGAPEIGMEWSKAE